MSIRVFTPIYKLVIEPERLFKLTFNSTTSDGELAGQDDDYETCHDAADAHHISSGSHSLMGQTVVLGTFSIWRSVLFFETAILPDGALIGKATLKIYGEWDRSDTEFNIQVVDGSDVHDPLEHADYGELLDEVISLGFIHSSEWITGDYNIIVLNAAGRAAISKTGTTKLAIRSSRDIGEDTPAGMEYVSYYNADAGAGYKPILEIEFTEP